MDAELAVQRWAPFLCLRLILPGLGAEAELEGSTTCSTTTCTTVTRTPGDKGLQAGRPHACAHTRPQTSLTRCTWGTQSRSTAPRLGTCGAERGGRPPRRPPRRPRAAHSPQAVLHNAVPAAPPAGAGVVALEEQGRLRHVELGQQPAVLGTDGSQGRAGLPATALTDEHRRGSDGSQPRFAPGRRAGRPQELQRAVPVWEPGQQLRPPSATQPSWPRCSASLQPPACLSYSRTQRRHPATTGVHGLSTRLRGSRGGSDSANFAQNTQPRPLRPQSPTPRLCPFTSPADARRESACGLYSQPVRPAPPVTADLPRPRV